MIDIGVILKELRIQHNLTQRQLAKKIGVSVTAIAGWENEFKFPTVDRLILLSKFYHVPLNFIVGIDRDRSIVLDGFTREQQNLLKSLVLEFQSKGSTMPGLSERQKNILGALIMEFQTS